MDFKQIQSIKDAVESYGDAKVDVVLAEELILKNTKTEAMYKVKYSFNEEGEITIDTRGAEMIAEKVIQPSKVEEFKDNCNTLFESIKSVFDDGSVDKLKIAIQELPNVNETDIMEEVAVQEDKKASVEWIESVFGEKIKQYQEEENEFKNTLKLFNENNDLIEGEYRDISKIKNELEQISEEYEAYKEFALKFGGMKKQIAESFGDEEIANKFFEGLDVGNHKVSITTNLVKLNKQYGDIVNVVEKSKEISGIFESMLNASGDGAVEGAPSPVVFNLAQDSKFRPKFFRFKMGMFTNEDVKTMMNEINFLMQCWGDINEEDLAILSNYKMMLDYMYNSGQINDHLIMEMIGSFNTKYAKDRSEEYNNGAMQLAWKNREQQKAGNAQGMA